MSIEIITENDFLNTLQQYHYIFDIKNFYSNLFQHCIFYGHPSVQKIEYIRFILKNVYLIENQSFNIEKHIHNISSNNRIDFFNLTINKSPIHWEIDFNYTGSNSNSITNKNTNDYFILQYLIEYLFKNVNINNSLSKIIVFNNLHKLQFHYQKMLYQAMEKQYNNIKFIFCTDYINRIEYTLISRCIQIRIPMFFPIYNTNKPYLLCKNNTIEYYICFYCIFNKKIQTINSIILHKDSNYFNMDNHCIYEICLIKNFNFEYIKLHTPLLYFDKLNEHIYDFIYYNNITKNSKSKNTQLVEKYNNIIKLVHNYFIDCHYINTFFKNWFYSFTNNKHTNNLQIKDFHYIISTISKLEYKSLYSDYNNYLIENFVSSILILLIQLNRTTTL